MRKFLLLSMLFLAGNIVAQFNLEHRYESNIAYRVKLEFSGEKYYVHNLHQNRLDLFNSDHTLWKSIDIPIPAQGFFVGISHVSDNVVNNDEKVEVVYSFYENGVVGGTYNSRVIAEDGTVLLAVPNCNYLLIDQRPGLTPKMIANGHEKKIYGLPGLSLEQTLPTTGNIIRTVLENSGEKYYQFEPANGQIKFYNPDYSLWKTVAISKPSDAIYESVSFVSETSINPDAALEIAFSYYRLAPGYIRTDRLVSENGNVLLSLEGNYGLQLSKIEGFPAKLMSHKTGVTVYNLPDLTVEHFYTQGVARTVLDVSGEKYYETNENQLVVYNNDHSVWKTINLPVSAEMYEVQINYISEHKFDQDDQIEVVYTAGNNVLLEHYIYESYVAKENGEILLTVPEASFLYMSEINGLDKKLIAGFTIQDSDAGPRGYAGEVYDVEEMMSTAGFENQVQSVLYPNPVHSLLNINAKFQTTQISIYNILGMHVKQQNGSDLKQINIDGLAAGHYIVKLTDADQKESMHKIIVSN